MRRLLILGGTGDASELAAKASNLPEIEVKVSIAGRTRQLKDLAGNIELGGLTSVARLTEYLRDESIDCLIDATHPFATQISLNAAAAAAELHLPRLMLVRPAWQPVIDDEWIEVDSVESAAAVLPGQAKRVFLTVGRQELACFTHLKDIWFLMRMIEPPLPDAAIPKGVLLYDRGPFAVAAERELLMQHEIDTIVTKNSGGDATYDKIVAAQELGVKVVMIGRPPVPLGEQVEDVEGALAWLRNRL